MNNAWNDVEVKLGKQHKQTIMKLTVQRNMSQIGNCFVPHIFGGKQIQNIWKKPLRLLAGAVYFSKLPGVNVVKYIIPGACPI